MKTITESIADQIMNDNAENLVWADGTPITRQELIAHFQLVQYDNGTWNLSHNTEDYYIEDIIF